jgi:RNA polymerase sigma-70 factor (ECF subfamily)
MTDLIKRLATGRDPAAFDELYRHFGPRVRAVMLRQGCSGELAEEIAQETLLTVWRKAHMFDAGKGSDATWIFTIARNLRIDRLRREAPWQPLPDEYLQVAGDDQPADEAVDERQRRDRLREVLQTLPADQRQVIELSFIDALPHSDIAERLQLPLGTVKSRIRLAAQKIREAMKELQ